MDFARQLWLRVETIHAVTYFDPTITDAAKALGASGFWMSYFGFRAAPMGAVASGVVEAVFFNFAPSFVRRWVPAVWAVVDPADLVAARSAACATSLRRFDETVVECALEARPTLRAATEAAVGAGRPLFCANRDLQTSSDDAVAELWQLCTSLREHRGDGHVAALTAAGLNGLDAHVLIALERGSDPAHLKRARGWTDDDWSSAVDSLASRGLLTADGSISAEGRRIRSEVEATTDRLAAAPFAALDGAARTRLLDQLTPLARAVAASGTIRYPNPIGLPEFKG